MFRWDRDVDPKIDADFIAYGEQSDAKPTEVVSVDVLIERLKNTEALVLVTRD